MPSPGHEAMEVLRDLPDDLYTTIGMVVVQFSYLEHVTNRIIYDLKGLDTPAGRQQLLDRDIGDRLKSLFELVDNRGMTVTVDRVELGRTARQYQGKRDLLSHAIFLRDGSGTIRVRDAKRGEKWQPPGTRGKGVDKSVEPSGEAIDPEIVAGLAESIGYLNRALEALWGELSLQIPGSRYGKP